MTLLILHGWKICTVTAVADFHLLGNLWFPIPAEGLKTKQTKKRRNARNVCTHRYLSVQVSFLGSWPHCPLCFRALSQGWRGPKTVRSRLETCLKNTRKVLNHLSYDAHHHSPEKSGIYFALDHQSRGLRCSPHFHRNLSVMTSENFQQAKFVALRYVPKASHIHSERINYRRWQARKEVFTNITH